MEAINASAHGRCGMLNRSGQILIGTILLDLNRHGNPKTPTYNVSDWIDRFQEAEFDGMELWEYHATLCSDDEREKLRTSKFPVTLYNTYCGFDDASADARKQAADMIGQLGSVGVKFNVGKDSLLRDSYLHNLRIWREQVPKTCTLLCECHPGTIVEDPDSAKAFFDDLEIDGWEIIVHCFIPEMDILKRWFDNFGPKITHAHVQLRNEKREVQRLQDYPERAKAALKVMGDYDFSGSIAIEFAKETHEPGESMDDLWTVAQEDLTFLREYA